MRPARYFFVIQLSNSRIGQNSIPFQYGGGEKAAFYFTNPILMV